MASEDRVSVFSADNRANVPVYPADVFVITKGGSAQIEQGGTSLPAEALAILVALDGEIAVEDDPDMGAQLRRILEEQGFKVTAAANRAEVIARLRVSPMPDLALLDVNLPDTNGVDILHNLKAHPALRAMPAIMVTAEAKRESVLRGLVGGADGYITKPFESGTLVNGVKAVLAIGA